MICALRMSQLATGWRCRRALNHGSGAFVIAWTRTPAVCRSLESPLMTSNTSWGKTASWYNWFFGMLQKTQGGFGMSLDGLGMFVLDPLLIPQRLGAWESNSLEESWIRASNQDRFIPPSCVGIVMNLGPKHGPLSTLARGRTQNRWKTGITGHGSPYWVSPIHLITFGEALVPTDRLTVPVSPCRRALRGSHRVQKEYIALLEGRLGGEDGPFTGVSWRVQFHPSRPSRGAFVARDVCSAPRGAPPPTRVDAESLQVIDVPMKKWQDRG